ncbi:hypothetical protein PFISCL1PPCAC_13261, partial [Pristionchus fissidentatus]
PQLNYSEYTPREWARLFGTRRRFFGLWSLLFGITCQILYIPSLVVFTRERKNTLNKGWRSSLCLIVVFAYGVGLSVFNRPYLVNSTHSSFFTIPFIPGRNASE